MKNKSKFVLVLAGLLVLSWAFASCSQSTSDSATDAVAGTWTASDTSSGITATSSIHFDGSGFYTVCIFKWNFTGVSQWFVYSFGHDYYHDC